METLDPNHVGVTVFSDIVELFLIEQTEKNGEMISIIYKMYLESIN